MRAPAEAAGCRWIRAARAVPRASGHQSRSAPRQTSNSCPFSRAFERAALSRAQQLLEKVNIHTAPFEPGIVEDETVQLAIGADAFNLQRAQRLLQPFDALG